MMYGLNNLPLLSQSENRKRPQASSSSPTNTALFPQVSAAAAAALFQMQMQRAALASAYSAAQSYWTAPMRLAPPTSLPTPPISSHRTVTSSSGGSAMPMLHNGESVVHGIFGFPHNSQQSASILDAFGLMAPNRLLLARPSSSDEPAVKHRRRSTTNGECPLCGKRFESDDDIGAHLQLERKLIDERINGLKLRLLSEAMGTSPSPSAPVCSSPTEDAETERAIRTRHEAFLRVEKSRRKRRQEKFSNFQIFREGSTPASSDQQFTTTISDQNRSSTEFVNQESTPPANDAGVDCDEKWSNLLLKKETANSPASEAMPVVGSSEIDSTQMTGQNMLTCKGCEEKPTCPVCDKSIMEAVFCDATN